MARRSTVGEDGLITEFGANIRVERNHPIEPDAAHEWLVFRKVDVSEDEDTTYTYRWERVGSPYKSEDAAFERADALASQE